MKSDEDVDDYEKKITVVMVKQTLTLNLKSVSLPSRNSFKDPS